MDFFFGRHPLQKFFELLQQRAQEQKEEKQWKIEEFKKMTKIEE